jgi:hypothetical protein
MASVSTQAPTGNGGEVSGYNPDEFKSLSGIPAEIRDLFDYIGRYKPHDIQVQFSLGYLRVFHM